MAEKGLAQSLILAFTGLLFLVFAIIFAVKKEKACRLIGGFNFLTEEQQAQYDRPRIARDYRNLFFTLAAVMFLGALAAPWLHYWALGGAFGLMLVLIFRGWRPYADEAFAKYKLHPDHTTK